MSLLRPSFLSSFRRIFGRKLRSEYLRQNLLLSLSLQFCIRYFPHSYQSHRNEKVQGLKNAFQTCIKVRGSWCRIPNLFWLTYSMQQGNKQRKGVQTMHPLVPCFPREKQKFLEMFEQRVLRSNYHWLIHYEASYLIAMCTRIDVPFGSSKQLHSIHRMRGIRAKKEKKGHTNKHLCYSNTIRPVTKLARSEWLLTTRKWMMWSAAQQEKRGERTGHLRASRATHVLLWEKDWTERLINLTMLSAERIVLFRFEGLHWWCRTKYPKVKKREGKRGSRLADEADCLRKQTALFSLTWDRVFFLFLSFPHLTVCMCVSGRRFSFLCSRLLSFNWEVGGEEGTHVWTAKYQLLRSRMCRTRVLIWERKALLMLELEKSRMREEERRGLLAENANSTHRDEERRRRRRDVCVSWDAAVAAADARSSSSTDLQHVSLYLFLFVSVSLSFANWL